MIPKELTKRVFLSYARRDQELAEEIGKVLTKKGLTFWHDRQIEVGADWQKEISRALETSDSMIAILNPHSFSSSWVRNELEHALFNEKYKNRLLPVLIGGKERDVFARLPWILTRMQFLRLPERQSARASARKVADAFIALLRSSREAK
jgi:hypothetical protein